MVPVCSSHHQPDGMVYNPIKMASLIIITWHLFTCFTIPMIYYVYWRYQPVIYWRYGAAPCETVHCYVAWGWDPTPKKRWLLGCKAPWLSSISWKIDEAMFWPAWIWILTTRVCLKIGTICPKIQRFIIMFQWFQHLRMFKTKKNRSIPSGYLT